MEILPEYLDTVFHATPPEDGWPPLFFIITACNPFSSGDRDGDDRSDSQLMEHLARLNLWRHRVVGASPDGRHREPGFAVSGIDRSAAAQLGALFLQKAIFEVDGDILRVVACGSHSVREAGHFRGRLRVLDT